MRKFIFILVLMVALLAARQAWTAEVGTAQYYNNRGWDYGAKGQHDQAITDYTKALEIDPRYDIAYNNRAVAFFTKKAYDRAWEDVRKAQSLGFKVPPGFLADLCKASGREK
jgi:tetratricopeptide (TPR) repeat protein